MKHNFKKTLSILLACLMLAAALSSLAGCEQPTDEYNFSENVDNTKTQLYVGYFNGGTGLEWITKAKELFEAKYPEYQVMIDTGKDEYQDPLFSNIKTNRQDMYILDGINYYKFVNANLLMDLTEEVTTPLSEFGEDKTIEQKLNESLKGYYKTNSGKYYGMPYHQSYHQMIYDVDLFDEYNLWFKDGGGFVNSAGDKKSAGQDGKYDTWDDGLPVTYSDFFLMMDRMVARGITPVTWSGQYADSYLTNFIHSFIADYEGEDFATNWCYDGQTKVIVNDNFTESEPKTFSLDPNDVQTVTVTPENFDQYMHSTAGKYYALKFAKELASNSMYRTYNFAESHTGVQRSFLMSNMEGVDKPIAMLFEGPWWMNEATSVFNEMAEIDQKYSKENRRFGVMPIPKADDGSSAPGHTVAPFSGGSAVVVSAFTDKADIAKLFFRFIHTDEVLRVFTQYSGVLRPFDCDLTPIYNSLPYFVKNSIDMRNDTTFIYKLPTGEKYKENDASIGFMQYAGLISTQIKETTSANPIIFFCDHPEISAKDYFLGMRTTFVANIPATLK